MRPSGESNRSAYIVQPIRRGKGVVLRSLLNVSVDTSLIGPGSADSLSVNLQGCPHSERLKIDPIHAFAGYRQSAFPGEFSIRSQRSLIAAREVELGIDGHVSGAVRSKQARLSIM